MLCGSFRRTPPKQKKCIIKLQKKKWGLDRGFRLRHVRKNKKILEFVNKKRFRLTATFS